ncbi:hypothetical protein G7Y79_00010g027680 [Physcia stellaris]|nr:hypothetical protein G7Y79_00010g027680 [Physcia stellaris]
MKCYTSWAKLTNSNPSEAKGEMPDSQSTQTRDTDIRGVGSVRSSGDHDKKSLNLIKMGNSAMVLQPPACEHRCEDVEKITNVVDPPTPYPSCQLEFLQLKFCRLEFGQLWRTRCPTPPLTAVQPFQEVDNSLSVAILSQLNGHSSDVFGQVRVCFNVRSSSDQLVSSRVLYTGFEGSSFAVCFDVSPFRNQLVPSRSFGSGFASSNPAVAILTQTLKPLLSKCFVASSAARSILPRSDRALGEFTCTYGRSAEDYAYETNAGSIGFQYGGMIPWFVDQWIALSRNSATAALTERYLGHRNHYSKLQSMNIYKSFPGVALQVIIKLGLFSNPVQCHQDPGADVNSGKERNCSQILLLATAADTHEFNEKALSVTVALSVTENPYLARDNLNLTEPGKRNIRPQVAASDATATEVEEKRQTVRADLSAVNRCHESMVQTTGFDRQIHTYLGCQSHNAESETTFTSQETVASSMKIRVKSNASKLDGEELHLVPRSLEDMVQDFGRLTIRKVSQNQHIGEETSKQDGKQLCLIPTHLEKSTEELRPLTIHKESRNDNSHKQEYKRPSAQSARPTGTFTKHDGLSRDLPDITEGSSSAIPARIATRSLSVSSTDTMYETSMASSTTSLSNDITEGIHTSRSRAVSASFTDDCSLSGDKAVSQEVDQEISQHTITSNVLSTIDQEIIPPSTSNSNAAKASRFNMGEKRSFNNSDEGLPASSKVTSTTSILTRDSGSHSSTVSGDVPSCTTHPTPTIFSAGLCKEEHTATHLIIMKEDIHADQNYGQESIMPQVQPQDTAQCGEIDYGTSRTGLPAIHVNAEDIDVELSDSVSQPENPFGEPIDEDMEHEDNTSNGDSSHMLNSNIHEDDHLMLDSGEVTDRQFLDTSPLTNGTTTIEMHSEDQIMQDISHEAPFKATEDEFTDQNISCNGPESIETTPHETVDDHDMSDADLQVFAISQIDDMEIDNASPIADFASTINNSMSKIPSFTSSMNGSEHFDQFQLINDDMALSSRNTRQASQDTALPISDMGFESAIDTDFHLNGFNGSIQSGSELGKTALSGDLGHTVLDTDLASRSLPSLSVRKRNAPQTKFAAGLHHSSNHKAAKQKSGIRRGMPQDDFLVPFAAAPGALDQIPTTSTILEDINKAVEALSLSPEVCELADEIAEMFDAEEAAKEQSKVEDQAWAKAQMALDETKAPQTADFDVTQVEKDDASPYKVEDAPTPTELGSGTRVQKSWESVAEAKSYNDSVQADLTSPQSHDFCAGAQTPESCGDFQAQTTVNEDTIMAAPPPCESFSGVSSNDIPKAGKRKYIIEDDQGSEELPEPIGEEKLKKHRVTEKIDGANPVLNGEVTYEDVIRAIPPKYKFSRIDVDMVIYLTQQWSARTRSPTIEARHFNQIVQNVMMDKLCNEVRPLDEYQTMKVLAQCYPEYKRDYVDWPTLCNFTRDFSGIDLRKVVSLAHELAVQKRGPSAAISEHNFKLAISKWKRKLREEKSQK